MKRALALLLLATLVPCAGCGTDSTTHTLDLNKPNRPAVSAVEYDVYRGVLEEWFVEGLTRVLVIQDRTASSPGYESLRDFAEENLPELEDGTFDAFVARAEDSIPFEDRFEACVPVAFITHAQLVAIFQTPSGWDEFYARYPGTPGIIELSRVGFNAAGDQALLYVGFSCHFLCGTGHLVQLTRVEDGWTITGNVMTWIS